MTVAAGAAATVGVWRRRWRRCARGFACIVGAYLVTLACGMPFAWPFDYCVNAGSTPIYEALRVPADGRRRVVVLQHGLWRSSYALLRLERTLAAHGYEVHNFDYPSTQGTVEQHAARLAAEVDAIYAAGPVYELSFVGHSLGGVVIEEYLRRPDAHAADNCVFIATPHRGAMLADLRKNWFLFRWAMGSLASLQLSPGAPLQARPLPSHGRLGAIVGDIGAGNASIPGDDDGTIAVGEAALPGAASITLPFGHTRIAYDPLTVREVLTFLSTGAFAPVDDLR